MRELNISTFIQVMQIGLKEHDTQFAAGTFLLEVLNQSDGDRFDIYREDLSDKKIGLLVSRQRPVPDGIKQASLVPELARAACDYYEDKVLKDMNPFRKNDVQNQLVKVIKEDKEISDKKRDELLDYYNNGQEGRFLGEAFLYVVNRPNKPGEEDSGDRFFFDVGKEAVICIRSPGQGEPEPDGEHGHLHWISMGGRLTLAILLAVAEIERENIQIQDAEGAAGRMGR